MADSSGSSGNPGWRFVGKARETVTEFLARHKSDLRRPMPLPTSFESKDPAPAERGAVAERIYNSRRRFERILGIPAAGPEMDILLELFIAGSKGRSVTVAMLCLASQLPVELALRHVHAMLEAGHLVRVADPNDRSRYFVSLSPEMAARLADLMLWMGGRWPR